ncbi:MAG TPA: hypothetical protein PKY05_16345, partial [Fibrobacteria bacterium]|nr:hypothetical protein [Fibrobacteria bacterium]
MIAAILLAVTGAATARDAGGFQEAFVRSPARVEACPGYEEFRRRAYERLQASVVHPLRMLARTQAEEEKARCEQLRSRLENTFANDWSGWGERDGMVEVRRDTQSLDLVSALAEFDAVHELSLEVVGLDVVRNGNRFEHKATFLVVARSHRLGDSTRTVERKSSMTGFGDLERASRELAGHPRVMASSILDDRRFLRTARVESLDSSAGTFRFVKGPGGIIPGRRLGVVDSNGQLQAWAIALGPEDRSRRWVARPVVGGLPSEGGILREIPGDVAWRADLSWLQVGDAWGGELGGGPRLPVGSWVRAGLDGMLRVHDFGSIAPTGLPLSWGVGLGVEPVVSFQRTFRR